MCEYCESNKLTSVLQYNNRKAMKVLGGQHQGVKVNSHLYIQGNMLILSGSGSYRSNFDCYYESQGLDIDDEPAKNGKSTYIHIKYCPFCGAKINSTEFEKTDTKDRIHELDIKLDKLKDDFDAQQIFMFTYWDNPGTIYDKSGYANIPEFINGTRNYKHIDYNDMTLEEIKNTYQKVICNLYYGPSKLSRCGKSKVPEFTFETKIKSDGFIYGRFKGLCYKLTEETLQELCNRGYAEFDKVSLTEMKAKREKIMQEINEVKQEIIDLRNYIKTL